MTKASFVLKETLELFNFSMFLKRSIAKKVSVDGVYIIVHNQTRIEYGSFPNYPMANLLGD